MPPDTGTELIPRGTLEPTTASWQADPVERLAGGGSRIRTLSLFCGLYRFCGSPDPQKHRLALDSARFLHLMQPLMIVNTGAKAPRTPRSSVGKLVPR